ncbi:PTS system cellobiose-specific IIA component [Breznakia sp. PF5-3]|uniref:PTS lactose/cellobiose transporter subunit IIA n=1 Tax=unclassified Breznakia TaxID=2623764 RepID=UPI002405B891|nr:MULTISPECIES: PTS lactose/cellobiose transporter subunit IIA [unclassified Breznakia]MDL2276573.1 PTS lactose/cellobiose transporter subunit IIA [Breznakia sp. OttesenSCG-928-G09]MDF9823857.1 PTS system cellobiose-specific IIA component [Breznakia sp. PM6-1]MDF9834577.1 PTS system cellobiose-specific IIA component [Breznakia sp. PF5-3]MDF9836806.1 PTS system cellobiose-specific IIA component [Breznakia sp. PFB2-8]MDF9858745.1 PTS system cellobiose-specific IIA component [Breznakia sp. PH5-2
MNEEIVEQAMTIILHAGNAKATVIEAMNAFVENNDVEMVKNKIDEAGKELGKAHEIQTSLLFDEMQGKDSKVGILMVHAQDHFMNAITIRDLANIMIQMAERKQ